MKVKQVCFLLSILYLTIAHCTNTDRSTPQNVEVSTDLGKIRGKTLTTRLGKRFYAFRGIRYAKPPVGDLRFKDPQPAEPWNDVFDATNDGPMCPQPPNNITEMSEDCLRLNVYTSELPGPKSNPNKPVVFYMHPGGFYLLSGQSELMSGPQLFMDRDIVLVTINYRIGSLGYLATGTKDAPGNAGFKDQVMAMKWVKRHISKFGGNPNSVTLLGYSAGALSITLHMVSPMSKNLFHRAIVMSASATAQWEVPTHQLDLAKRQAGLLQCPQENIEQMVQCMKKKDAREYASTLPQMFDFGAGSPIGHPVMLYLPVIEPDFGQERFLLEDPTISYQQGRINKVPIIAGITKDEFVEPAVLILKDDKLRKEMDENWEKVAPITFLYERGTPRSKNISQELRAAFLGSGPLSLEKSLDGLRYLFADSLIGYHIHRLVHLASKYTTVYYYKFAYQGRYSFFNYPDNKPFGVVHHDELIYLFSIPVFTPLFTRQDPEHKTVERLTRMWTQFANTGNPNKPNDEYLCHMNWTPFNKAQENYMEIGNELTMKRNLYTERYAVWDRLFPLRT